MGNKVVSHVKRAVVNYNVEERAFKAMEKHEKSALGKAAPKYPERAPLEDDLKGENDKIMEDLKKKDEKLVSWMQKMALTRVDAQNREVKSDHSSGPHLSRDASPEHEYGYDYGFGEPDVIPEGKCTMKQALTFIHKHQNSQEYNVNEIAQEYKLTPQDVQNVLTHFKTFKILIPKKVARAIPDMKNAVDKTSYNQPPRTAKKLALQGDTAKE